MLRLYHADMEIGLMARKWIGIYLMVALCCTSLSAVAQNLESGTSIQDSISVTGQQDTFTFSGLTGQTVFLTMVDEAGLDPNTPGNITPGLYLYDPNDNLIASDPSDYTTASISASLPLNGTYKVIAKDYNDTQTGPYELHFASAPGTAEHGILPSGSKVTEQIDLGDLDTYRFYAETGDRVTLTLVDLYGEDPNTDGNFTPGIYLYDPSGTLVASDPSDYITASIVNRSLTYNGYYTVVAKDYQGTLTGAYELHYSNSAGTQELGGLPTSRSVTETLTLGDLDSYSFYAETNDRVFLSVADLAGYDPNVPGDITPAVYLYDPTGELLASDPSDYITANIINRRIELTGTHTVLVKDYTDTKTGPYEIHFERARGFSEHGQLARDQSVNQTLELGDLDSYVFYASAGNVISLTMTDLEGDDPNMPGDITPGLYIYAPDGSLFASDPSDNITAAINNRTISQSGTYTVVARDYTGTKTGPYQLSYVNSDVSTPGTPAPHAPDLSGGAVRPMFEWSPIGPASWYNVWVQDGNGVFLFSRWYTASSARCSAGWGSGCSIESPMDIPNGGRWWVLSWNNNGYGTWSNYKDFTSGPGLPGTPSAVAPLSSSSTTTPLYEWTRVPNASWYYLWIADATGRLIQQWVTAGQANCAVAGQTCSYRFNTSVAGSTNWWIRAYNSEGVGNWSGQANFTP